MTHRLRQVRSKLGKASWSVTATRPSWSGTQPSRRCESMLATEVSWEQGQAVTIPADNPCRGKGGERAYKTHNIWQNLGNSAIYIHLPEIHWNSTNESICSFAFPGQMPLLPKDYIVGPCIFVLRVVGPMHAELVPTFGWPKVTRHNHWIELVGIFFMLLDLLMPSKDNVLLQKKLCWNLKPRERISNPDPFPCIWCSNAKHTQSETLAFA